MMQIIRRAGGKLNQRSRVMYHCPWGGVKTYENAVKSGSGNADFGSISSKKQMIMRCTII
tara:strand:- start:1885 stop:2064 length:180 start_codon:yes stop_codon:yes gene_type:complete